MKENAWKEFAQTWGDSTIGIAILDLKADVDRMKRLLTKGCFPNFDVPEAKDVPLTPEIRKDSPIILEDRIV
jgi:hypothetical protein